MKIESTSLKNFRCFGDTTTTIALDDITTLIGPNGAGKTAALAVNQTCTGRRRH
jgi:predicted ATP-binding protein involved in virulence